ncbi:MAG: hypothetical protein R3C39_09155 [Dehalococcoidia bacterium]
MPLSRLGVRSVVPAAVAALALLVALGIILTRGGNGPGVEVQSSASTGGLAYAEFGPTADRVFIAEPGNLTDRRLVATIDHVEGWGINPAFSVAGSRAAYTVLPPSSRPRRDEPAELWLLDLETGDQRRLASDADLLVQPVFDASGEALVYRSTRSDGTQEIVRVDLATSIRRPAYTYRGDFGVFPAGVTPEGEIVIATLSTQGTDLLAVREGGEPRLVAHASDQIARDWRLSPDGTEVSYLAPELLGERWVHRLNVVSVADGTSRLGDATAAARSEQFGPVWMPEGGAVTVGYEAYPDSSAPAATVSLADGTEEPLAAPTEGFDVPLGWSPDGQYLAARSFDGATSYEPGRETMVVISADGERFALSAATEVIYLGWSARG